MTATACTDTLEEAALPKPLSVDVNARDITARAPIHGTALPDASSIGISLLAEDGTPYDGVTYANLKYTASGTAPDQTWSTPNIPTLSSTPAKLVAYYPWADGTDYTAVPVETDTQTDYMYSKWLTGLSNANPNASIVMQHALTAVRVALVKGDFTADVDVSSVSVKSPAFATAGSLDATTGALSGLTGIGEAVTVTADFPLTAQATNVEVMAVPDVNVASGVTTVITQIGDRKYSVNINFTESYKQGYIYTYTLTLNNTGMEMTSVAVTPWQEGTTGSGNLEVLPVYKQNDYVVKISSVEENYSFIHNPIEFTGVIDWGDGTTTAYDTPIDNPEHIYEKAGNYIVKATGVAKALSGWGTKYDELIYIGEGLGITSMERAFAASHLKKIHPGALDGCTEVTIFYSAFTYTDITKIPAGLFDKCTKAYIFDDAFLLSELSEIPEGLFDKCTEVISFYCTFLGTKITEIPEGLFDKCTEVEHFEGTFQQCPNIKSIPVNLFRKNTKAKSFEGTFAECNGLLSIPEGLFENNTEVTNFCLAFQNCTGLTSIPEGLFKKNTKVTTFDSTFNGCTTLTSIPAGLFDKCTKVTNFSHTFSDCTALTGESPYTTINVDGADVKVHLYERSLYPEHFTAPTNKTWCFGNCTGLSDYSNIPSGWN